MTHRITLMTYLLSLVIIAATGSSALAGGIFDDYESDTPETYPTGALRVMIVGADNNVVGVVDDGTISPGPYADPFGPAGNQSLVMEHISNNILANSGSVKVLYDTDNLDNTPGETGTVRFSADMYFQQTDPSVFEDAPMMELRIGRRGNNASHESAGTMAVRMRLSTFFGGAFIEIDEDEGSGNYVPIDNLVPLNTAFTLNLVMDTVAQTYTGDIDGTPLTDNAGAKSVFAFQANLSNIDEITGVEYVAAYNKSPFSATFWVDNTRLTPEPTSLSLVGLGSLLLLGRRTQRRRE